MADTERIIALLQPLVSDLSKIMEGRDDHDPLALVRERLMRLIHQLNDGPAVVEKFNVLQELGFLSEHSHADQLAQFHEVVGSAIDETMTPGWD